MHIRLQNLYARIPASMTKTEAGRRAVGHTYSSIQAGTHAHIYVMYKLKCVCVCVCVLFHFHSFSLLSLFPVFSCLLFSAVLFSFAALFPSLLSYLLPYLLISSKEGRVFLYPNSCAIPKRLPSDGCFASSLTQFPSWSFSVSLVMYMCITYSNYIHIGYVYAWTYVYII